MAGRLEGGGSKEYTGGYPPHPALDIKTQFLGGGLPAPSQ